MMPTTLHRNAWYLWIITSEALSVVSSNKKKRDAFSSYPRYHKNLFIKRTEENMEKDLATLLTQGNAKSEFSHADGDSDIVAKDEKFFGDKHHNITQLVQFCFILEAKPIGLGQSSLFRLSARHFPQMIQAKPSNKTHNENVLVTLPETIRNTQESIEGNEILWCRDESETGSECFTPHISTMDFNAT
ncbi:hypothetical protein RRG08_024086 [Elysia crispata]|uniref:Uncharacterized protein n=1 Tax=Elysia crispata TaxID=231223 RepID=A0AAE0ZQR3_9GAST|nr:hypothetical protein RRG08_024086 [Elysia crispata]